MNLEVRYQTTNIILRSKITNISALYDHVINTEQTVNWEDVKVTHRESKQQNRNVLQMTYIETTPNTTNKKM